jgi:hypothetical protein
MDPDTSEEDPVAWADCPERTSVEAMFGGPCGDAYLRLTIDAAGSVTSISGEAPTAIGVDFSEEAPELGTAIFELPLLTGEPADLSAGDRVQVDYECQEFFGRWGHLTVTKDGVVLLHSVNGGGIAPFEFDGVTFVPVEAGCEPFDYCGPWSRYYLEVDCADLPEPVRVHDGTEAVVPCGPGYRVAVSLLTGFAGDVMTCTDTPDERTLLLVVRQ